MEVPHLERVILGGSDQDRLHRVKGQSTNPVKMTPQGEFRVPCFSHGVLIVANLKTKHQIKNRKKETKIIRNQLNKIQNLKTI